MFRPSMSVFTQGISASDALRHLSWSGIVADLWQAEGRSGGNGHYLSPDPRIVVFFDPCPIRIAASAEGPATARIAYVPAGVPVWCRIDVPGRFRHLDLHFGSDAIAGFRAAGLDLPAGPVLVPSHGGVESLALLIADEIAAAQLNPPLLNGLVKATIAYLLREDGTRIPAAQAGGLTPSQHQRVMAAMRAGLHRRLSVAELAQIAGLSESWFARAFRQTTGETPARALSRARIEAAKSLLSQGHGSLADIAAATGFADQAHFTRVFRAHTSATPAAWRSAAQAGGTQG